jgi:hypothetical protein
MLVHFGPPVHERDNHHGDVATRDRAHWSRRAEGVAAKNLIMIDLLQQWATIDVIATCGLERPAALLETGDGPIGVARGHALHQIWWE